MLELSERQKLIIAYVAYSVMLTNSVFLSSGIVGILAFSFFVVIMGIWAGKMYGGRVTAINFLIGCFMLLALSIVFLGSVIYLMIFSSLFVWFFLALLPISCYCLDKRSVVENARAMNVQESSLASKLKPLNARAIAKVAVFFVTVSFGFTAAWMGRTGASIYTIVQSVSYAFWLILAVSCVMVYIIWREKTLPDWLKLASLFVTSFLVFGAPLLVYSNFITEDSFSYVGVIRSVMQTGIYGWAPNLPRTGYFAATILTVVSTSTQGYLEYVYKLLPPLLASIYVPLFSYLILQRVSKKMQVFSVLVSLFLFPTMVFLSIPLEKTFATVFFVGSMWFSLLLLDKAALRKAEMFVLCLLLLAIPFLHDYFGVFAAIPLLLSLFLRSVTIRKDKRSLLLIVAAFCFASLLIPGCFVLGTFVSKTSTATVFSFPTLGSVIKFWLPSVKSLQDFSLNGIAYLYSDSIVWVRYAVLISSVLVLRKSISLSKPEKNKIWLILTVLAFWLGYFLLKTCTLNPPEEAKDYRFGFFVDLALVPLAGIVLSKVIEETQRIKIQLNLRNKLRRSQFSFRPPHFIIPAILTLILVFSVCAGFNFDRIMERPTEAQGIGRYVVTDGKLTVFQYIRNMSGEEKYVILSDNHMGEIAQGVLTLNFTKAALFNINSGCALSPYFGNMRQNPSRSIMNQVMKETDASISYFIIGLDDWRGWQSQSAYWIDSAAIEKLKTISDEWRVFGEQNNMFVFVFKRN